MIRKIIYFVALILLAACGRQGKFSVSGELTDAGGEILYFEKTGLLKDSSIDSVKLDSKGLFKFKTQSPKYPEFYRLRLKEQRLILGIDSVENILIEGSGTKLAEAKITGSAESEQIQKLRKAVLALQRDFDRIENEPDEVKKAALRDTLSVHLASHRREVFNMILNNPMSLASYFSLYQQIDGNYIFSPFAKEDLSYYRALATAYHHKMPDYERTKSLYNMVLVAIQEERQARRQIDWSKFEISEESGFIDLELKDQNGYPRRLSALKGKPILLDFSAYNAENSVAYAFELREIYNRYNAKGLQIYQVSLDSDRLFWQQSVSNLPWMSVIDENGRAARLYNVQQLPTLYLIDAGGTLVGKYTDIKNLTDRLEKIFR